MDRIIHNAYDVMIKGRIIHAQTPWAVIRPGRESQ